MRPRSWIRWWWPSSWIHGFWFQESSLLLFSVSFLFYQCLALNVESRISLHVRDVGGLGICMKGSRISSLFLYVKLRAMSPSTQLAVLQLFSFVFATWGLWWWWFPDPAVDLLSTTVYWTCYCCFACCCVQCTSQNCLLDMLLLLCMFCVQCTSQNCLLDMLLLLCMLLCPVYITEHLSVLKLICHLFAHYCFIIIIIIIIVVVVQRYRGVNIGDTVSTWVSRCQHRCRGANIGVTVSTWVTLCQHGWHGDNMRDAVSIWVTRCRY